MLSLGKQILFIGLSVLDNQCVPHSKFPPVSVVHYNATSWASGSWWLSVISTCAAGASMYKKCASSAHLRRFLRLEIESAGPLNGLMHDVNARGKFVGGGRQRSNIGFTLLGRIVISSPLSAVAVSVNSVGSWASSEPAWFLVVVVGHRWAWGQRGAAAVCAGVIICIVMEEFLGELEEGLG